MLPGRRTRGLASIRRIWATHAGRSRHPLSRAAIPAGSPRASAWITRRSWSRSRSSTDSQRASTVLIARNTITPRTISSTRLGLSQRLLARGGTSGLGGHWGAPGDGGEPAGGRPLDPGVWLAGSGGEASVTAQTIGRRRASQTQT